MLRRLLHLPLVALAGCQVYAGSSGRPVGIEAHSLPATYRTIAILPIRVAESQVRGFTQAGQPDTTATTRQRAGKRGEKIAYALQAALYAQLQAGQTGQGYTMWLQPTRETNLRLQRAGITYDNLPAQTAEHLQQVLGIDALLTGQTLLTKIPVSVVLASPLLPHQIGSLPRLLTATHLTLQDSRMPQLLWQTNFSGSSKDMLPQLASADFAGKLMQGAATTFPYR